MSAETLTDQELQEFLASQAETSEGAILNDPEASGRMDAFLAGMTNNEEYKTRWLAEKRFPDLVELGVDPIQYYYVDDDGDLSYKDPTDNFKAKKEFKEGFFGTDVDYLDNIGPTGQFLAEVIPGVIGMGLGFAAGGVPGAVAGGGAGTAGGGAIAYGTRGGISNFFGGPPLEIEKAVKDLTLSTAFGSLPIGVPSRAMPKAFQGIYEKFPGVEGREALQDVVLNGGKTVDDKLAYMQNKYPDITITRAEADELVGQGFALQAWLKKQPKNEQLVKFYQDRNTRVKDIAENFFDEILSGKYVDDALKNKLTGKAAVDADLDVGSALQNYLKQEKEALAKRVKPMYDEAYSLDVNIDVSDILDDVIKVIENPNTSAAKKTTYKKIQKALIDGNTGQARNTTELLHEGLKDDFNRVFASLSSGNNADAILKQEITGIRNSISKRMKEANPSYKEVTNIYDEVLGTSQQLEKSIAGQFAKVVDLGGTRAATLSKKLFSGNVKPDEILELKRILQETDEGATAWQNLKGTWLSSQWEDVLVSQTNPLGEPSAYLRAMGIKQPSKAFPTQKLRYSKDGRIISSPAEIAKFSKEVGEMQAKGKKAKMWQAIFEPDELSAFIDLTDLMQTVGRIQTQGGSDTFANLAIDQIVTSGSKQIIGSGAPGKAVVGKTLGVVDAATNVVPKLFFQGTSLANKVNAAQKDAFIDLLIAHVVDPKKRVVMQEGLEMFKPNVYLLSQTFGKGGIEGVKNLADTMREQNERLLEEQESPSFGPLSEEPVVNTEDLQTSMNQFEMPQINQPIFEAPSSDLTLPQIASPTILPDERDREIAMRQQAGIAGLV
tara:strand:+ start:1113 stop:3614 length:2502 start_codon:yes stop_codon:yes gene_type:complete